MVFRDGGLPASRFLAKVHSKHEMPLNALILTTALVVIFGCIFLGSSRYETLDSLHCASSLTFQRLQCDHLRVRRSSRRLLCHPTGHQLPSRSQDATTTTIRSTWSAWLDVQFARHCIRDRHDGAFPFPARPARHGEQHEYVTVILPLPCVLSYPSLS